MKTSSIGPCTALRKRSGGAFLQLHFCKSSQTSVDKKGATVEIMTLKTLLTRELLHHDTTVIIYSNINRYILATESISFFCKSWNGKKNNNKNMRGN